MRHLRAMGIGLCGLFWLLPCGARTAFAQLVPTGPSEPQRLDTTAAAPLIDRVVSRFWSERAVVRQTEYSPEQAAWVPPIVDPEISGCCDLPCDIACDGLACDACDGFGYGNCDTGGACCLLGGHDAPYDFSDDTLGLGESTCLDIGGWVQFGYHSRPNGLFNDHPDRFNNHQSWIYIDKPADGDLGLDWGFRADLMYGVDAQDTQSFGNDPGRFDFENGFDHGIFGWAIPQLYVDVAYRDWSVRLGHFYTLLGYEVVTAPDNFFYSHAFTMYNSEAFTHTGALATYAASDDVEMYGGWTAGWDTGFDQFAGGSNFLGGFRVQLMEWAAFTYITTIGDFGKIGDGYSHSLVLDLQLADDLNYIIQSDLLHTSQPCVAGGGGAGPMPPMDFSDSTDTIGINQYLIYDVCEWLALGGRAEWWKADGVSYYEVTGGVNIKPTGNLIIRPEVRYQWSPSGNDFSGITNPDNPAGLPLDEGTIFGVDAILTF